MGPSLCERNGLLAQRCCSNELYFSSGFSIPRRLIFGVASGMKKLDKGWVLGLRTRSGRDFNCLLKAEAANRSADGNLLENELEFKPSFDEYLKVLECVRTGRKKKHTLSSERYNLNNEGSSSLGDSDGDSSGGQVEGKESGGRGLKGANKLGFEDKGNFGNPSNLVGDQLESVCGKLNVNSENRRWEKGKSKSVDDSKMSGEFKGVKRIGFDVKSKSGISHNNLVQEKMDVKERKYEVEIDRKCDVDSGNGRWVKEKDTRVDGSKRKGESKGVKMIGFEEEGNVGISRSLVQYKLDFKERKHDVVIDRDSKNGRWAKMNHKSVEGSKRKGESRGVKTIELEVEYNSGIYYNLVQHKLDVKERKYDVGIYKKWDMDSENGRCVKRKYMSVEESKRNAELDRHRSKTDKGSLLVTNVGLERNYSQIGKRSVEKGKFRRNCKPIVETNNDEELQLERTAFKPLEGFIDVVDKPQVSRNEMEERIHKLASCLNGADADMPEWMFSKMMRSAQIRFSDHAMLRIIHILGKLRNWRRVLQLIEWLQLRDHFKSYKIRNIQTAALAVLGKARRPVEALNLFHAMQQQMSTYPDLVAYRCIAVILGQAGHMKELFDVIDSMRSPPKRKFETGIIEKWDPRLEPDIIVYNSVLNACVQRKLCDGAFWVLQKIKEQGHQPSSTTYGLVMEVMFACGKYDLVHDFFNKMTKSSIPNALTYKVVVNALWKEGKTDEAVSVVESMERRGIIGSAALYYDLARCLCSAGRCQEALTQIEKICRFANKPLVVTYTGLIQACLDAGYIRNGANIFNLMHKFCSPNLITCNIMLRAYTEHAMFKEAKGLFHNMLEDSNGVCNQANDKDRIVPDLYTFNTMLDSCVRQQQWDDLELVYKQMLRHGYPFNAKRHLRMIMEASRAGKRELLETTWKYLARAGQSPPPLLAKEIFCVKLEQGDHASALSSISSHHSSELQVFSRNAWFRCFKENAHRFQKSSLMSLVHEGSIMMSRSDSPNPVLENLVTTCRDFVENNAIAMSEMYSAKNSQ